MTLDELLEIVHGFDGVLDLAPVEGSKAPEIAWGDHFFYYAPDGVVPKAQPYATVVTKDYPGEPSSNLGNGRWRLNIHGQAPAGTDDITAEDAFFAHPVYPGWISVVNPGPATSTPVGDLLRSAHEAASQRAARRADHDADGAG